MAVYDVIDRKWEMYSLCLNADKTLELGTHLKLVTTVLPFHLRSAEPFYWESRICDLVVGAGPSLTAWRPSPSDFLSPSGFNWFEKSIALPEIPGSFPDRMTGFLWVIDGDRVLLAASVSREGANGSVWGTLLSTPLDSDLLKSIPLTIPGDGGEEEVRDAKQRRADLQVKYMAACVLFAKQRVATTKSCFIPRGVARRNRRFSGDETEFQVVSLRRPENSPPPDRPGLPVDWQWQWMVRGHWRNQVCGEGRTERHPTWITPYIKGPDDKPFKPPSDRIFDVRR